MFKKLKKLQKSKRFELSQIKTKSFKLKSTFDEPL